MTLKKIRKQVIDSGDAILILAMQALNDAELMRLRALILSGEAEAARAEPMNAKAQAAHRKSFRYYNL